MFDSGAGARMFWKVMLFLSKQKICRILTMPNQKLEERRLFCFRKAGNICFIYVYMKCADSRLPGVIRNLENYLGTWNQIVSENSDNSDNS